MAPPPDGEAPRARRRRTAIAILWGALNHVTFVAAVCAMVSALYGGLHGSRGPFHGTAAWAANAALAAQFPLLHSFLLTRGGRRWLRRLAPPAHAGALVPTTFTILASLQVLATFTLWSPSGVLLFDPHGLPRRIFQAAFAGSWLFLGKALRDAGLGLQTGAVGWWSVLRGRSPAFGSFPTRGLFRRCRQPVYLAFACTLWTGPVHTLDGLVLAIVWSAYCVAGPLLKERRSLAIHGEAYARYRAAVPYLVPRLRA